MLQFSVQAQSKEEKRVAAAVETYRAVLVNPDKVVLEKVLAEELSYGHPSGEVEGKTTVIEQLVSGSTDWLTIDLRNQTIQIAGKTALVRHRLAGKLNASENLEKVNLHVLLVWQKHRGQWQLLARQAVKI